MVELEQKTMGKYCKAYPLARLRSFPGWSERIEKARPDAANEDALEGASGRVADDDPFVYLQENYVVTDGIFMDESIIFADVSPEWIDFCTKTLAFQIPAFEPLELGAGSEVDDQYDRDTVE